MRKRRDMGICMGTPRLSPKDILRIRESIAEGNCPHCGVEATCRYARVYYAGEDCYETYHEDWRNKKWFESGGNKPRKGIHCKKWLCFVKAEQLVLYAKNEWELY